MSAWYTIANFFEGMFYLVGVVAVVLGMILLYRKVIPQKLDGTFSSKWMQRLHDYFNFKTLYIESVLKVIFTVLTVAFVVFGVVTILTAFTDLLFNMIGGAAGGYFERYIDDYFERFFLQLLGGLGSIVICPVIVRLSYEFTMMLILMVKNVMEINNKIKAPKEDDKD